MKFGSVRVRCNLNEFGSISKTRIRNTSLITIANYSDCCAFSVNNLKN